MNTKNNFGKFDPDLWIELLVDGQLDFEQRKQVFQHCEQSPGCWKKLAVAFCDQQSLISVFGELEEKNVTQSALEKSSKTENRPGDSVSSEKRSIPVDRLAARKTSRSAVRFISWLTLAASVLFFGLGWVASGWNSGSSTDAEIATRDKPAEQVTTVSYRLQDPVLDALERNNLIFENQIAKQKLNRIQQYLKNNPALFQVKNDKTTAIYHSEHRLPDFLIQALVFAGHRIHISQAFVDVSLPDGTKIGHPVHSYEIEKFALAKEVNLLKKGI